MRRQSPLAELEQLLLRAALFDGTAALDAWDRAKALPRHIDDAPYRVLPQLYRNLSALGVEDPDMERLKGVYRHCWTSNQRVLAEAGGALDALRRARIDALALGGASDVALPIERLGVLVRSDAAAEVLVILRSAGWSSARERGAAERLLRVGDPVLLERAGVTLVLRTNPFWEPVPEEAIWNAAAGDALDPAHELMRACTAGLAMVPDPVRWVPDAVAAIRSAGAELDWERLARDAEAWCMTARIAADLGTLAADFAQPVPPEVLERLRRARRPLHERAAHSVARRNPRRGAHRLLQWHRQRVGRRWPSGA